ncbi:MFS transporter [Deferribacterales bacterium RsTz2092]
MRSIFAIVSIYLAYFAHGIQAITISQGRDTFIAQWDTDLAGIMNVIAFTGMGKLFTILLFGEISDRLGRKPMMILGSIGYVLFFTGLVGTDSYVIACLFAFLGGASTSSFDSAAYPALQEIFPIRYSTSALVLLKGAIALSGMFFPLLVGLLSNSEAYSYILLAIPLAISVLVFILAFIASFKPLNIKQNQTKNVVYSSKPSFAIEGVLCLIYGGIAQMTFFIIQQSITIYGRDVVGMGDMASRALMSYNSIGSIVAVITMSMLMARGLRSIAVLLLFTTGSFISLLLLVLAKTPLITSIVAFTIGFFAAGGALQTGAALLSEYFPVRKGRSIGMYYTFMGLAAFGAPKISSIILQSSTHGLVPQTPEYIAAEITAKSTIINMDLLVATAGVLVIGTLALRYKGIFGKSPFAMRG